MSALSNVFSFLSNRGASSELPELYPVPIRIGDFVSIDVQNIYMRILVDVFERTSGIPEEKQKLLWDNCVKSEISDGLITLVSKAMVDMADLYLVYDPATEVIRKATQAEERGIKEDYVKRAKSEKGVYISFKNYKRTTMVKFYSELEYLGVGGLYKAMNLSKAVQIKIDSLRAAVSLADSAEAKKQAAEIAEALSKGKSVALDAKDILELLVPDLSATEKAMDFVAQKQSFYLGLPASYFKGAGQSSSLSDTGKADSKAVERGLRPYFYSVVKPIADVLFEVKTSFKSDDFEMISTGLEMLKTFEITSDELLAQDNKRKMINKVFGFPENTKGDAPEKIVTPPALPPGQGNAEGGQSAPRGTPPPNPPPTR